MLVLGRRKEEEIVIADNIVIKVIEIRGDKVRLGITAPTPVSVMRRELLIDRHPAHTEETTPDGVERPTS